MIPLRDVIPSRTFPALVITLIAFAFLFELTLSDRQLAVFVREYGLVPATFSFQAAFTSMFLHDGWMHFLGNMLYLWIFGDNVEDSLGHGGFVLFYILCGGVAAIAQTVVHPDSTIPMIGASGAIAGVMGAYFVLFPHSRILAAVFLLLFLDIVEIPAIFFLGIWFLMQLFSGVGSLGATTATGGTAFWAHIGGFVVGVLGGLIVRMRANARQAYWHDLG